MSDAKFLAREIANKLTGFVIKSAIYNPDTDDVGFICQRDPHGKDIEEKEVWITCDPEGNGPGWLSIEDPQ